MNSTFRVSICGGGIGGLTLALVIGKYGQLPVEIFEGGPTVTTAGAGINLYARTLDIMKEMGLYDELVKMSLRPPEENMSMKFRKSDQQDGYHWFLTHLKRGYLSLHRKDLIDFLLRHIPDSCKIHTSKRISSYTVDAGTGEITLHFSDGSTTTTHVLVGSDGIHSVTRRVMYLNLASETPDDDSRGRLLRCIDPVWTGGLVYRSLVPTEKLPQEYGFEAPSRITLYLGKNKYIVAYPISQGQFLNVSIFIHNIDAFGTPFEGRWVENVSEKEILDQFEDWEVCAKVLTKCIEKPSRWALHSVRQLPCYLDGRVVLLGDAAHAMEPNFAAGAGQAMEDAFVLGRLLTHELTHGGNVQDALKVYEQVRLPFANHVVRRSRDVGLLYSLYRPSANGPVPVHDSPEGLDYVCRSIQDAWEWQSESLHVWSEAEERWRAMCNSNAQWGSSLQ